MTAYFKFSLKYFCLCFGVIFYFMSLGWGQSPKSVDEKILFGLNHEVKKDLNSDKKMEKIRLMQSKDSGRFLLYINNQHVEITEYGNQIIGFKIVDVNKEDVYQEIAVESEEYGAIIHNLYRYTGKTIVHIGRVGSNPTYDGKGNIIEWRHMGFWGAGKLYHWDEAAQQLKFVPQEFYFVGQSYPITCQFPIYSERNKQTIINYVYPGSKTEIVLFYPTSHDQERISWDGWYLIKTENDVLGWVHRDQMKYECFEGLVIAG